MLSQYCYCAKYDFRVAYIIRGKACDIRRKSIEYNPCVPQDLCVASALCAWCRSPPLLCERFIISNEARSKLLFTKRLSNIRRQMHMLNIQAHVLGVTIMNPMNCCCLWGTRGRVSRVVDATQTRSAKIHSIRTRSSR